MATIEAAATDLVLEHGLDRVTVDMICEAAGVSQRTFFNHFKTKDAALLGHDLPTIDQRAARAFIVSDGPLLAEAIHLIRVDPGLLPATPEAIARRMEAVSSHPTLIAKQMEQLAGIETELREIIELRLRRTAPPSTTDDEIVEEADLVTHLLAGTMRYLGLRYARNHPHGTAPTTLATDVADTLTRVLPKLN